MNDSKLPPISDLPASDLPVVEPNMSAPAFAEFGPSWHEQDGLLRDLWLQNKTPQEISEALKRSVAAIMTRAARLGLPRRSAPGRKPGSIRTSLPDSRGNLPQNQSTRAPVMRTAPAADTGLDPQASTRICLMCLRSFRSMGRHNRICSSCKSSSEYASAASTADIHLPV